MPMTDPIADLLTRIRNANQKAFEKLEVPHSKFKEQIVRILKDEGYLKDYRILRDQGRSVLKISMKYGEREKRVITRLERVSKPSRRIYVGVEEIPRVQGGVGVAILSTPRRPRVGQTLGGERLRDGERGRPRSQLADRLVVDVELRAQLDIAARQPTHSERMTATEPAHVVEQVIEQIGSDGTQQRRDRDESAGIVVAPARLRLEALPEPVRRPLEAASGR